MAQTYQNADGTPATCFPAADVIGTTLTYTRTAGTNTLASVTVFFNIHTDEGGAQRDAFITIKCVSGGPTSDFRYTTVGDTGHNSQYEIHTVADCSKSGGGPPLTFSCLDGTCVSSFPPGSGVPKDVCDRICIKPDTKYVCKSDVCVPSLDPTRGVDKETCEAFCAPTNFE